VNRPAILRLASLWICTPLLRSARRLGVVHVQGGDAAGSVATAHFCNAALRQTMWTGAAPLRRLNYRLGALAERRSFGKSSTRRVIAVSHKVASEIQRHYGVDAQRIEVIRPGVDVDAFHPKVREQDRAAARARLGLRDDQFVVLFVGADYRRKGLPALLDALDRLPSHVRILAVGVPPHATLTGRASVRSERVILAPATERVAAYHAAADCLALPTVYDTFSLATLEAMASGLPVIVSSSAGIVEVLKDGVDSLVITRSDDVDALAGHISRLAGDSALASRLGAAARETAERHSWDRVVAQLLSVYRTVHPQ